MIAVVPEIYPDELVFSFCSRYHQRMGYRSRESTGRDLFENAMTKPAIDFPSRLKTLAQAYAFGAWITVDRLIECHTLLPFYQQFVPPNRISQIRTDMEESRGGAVHGRIGVLTNSVKDQNLRFCPACVRKDRATLGETYWHRLHHLPGIDVCPQHRMFLENTTAHPCPRTRKAFVTAEQSIPNINSRKLDKSQPDHQAYLKLAQDAQWLLDHPNSGIKYDLETLYSRWFYARDLSWYSGQVKATFLCEKIQSHYSPALLDRFNCRTDRQHNWVRKLIHNMDKAHHPIEHLLMIQFLGLSVKEFFDPPLVQPPFGDGPWPCLNPACNHFRKRVITEYELNSSREDKTSTAIFRCECGLIYCREDRGSSLDPYQATRFVSVTSSWLNKLRLEKQSFENAELANRFCTSPKAILDLLFRSEFISIPRSRSPQQVLLVQRSNPTKALRTKNRVIWLGWRAQNPDLPRGALQKRYGSLLAWLSKHDAAWLQRHLPPRLKQHGPPPRTNWPKRDKELAQEVRQLANRIRSAPERPIRVSFTSLAQQIGTLAVITKRAHLLPLTKQALLEVSETAEDCATRRVYWAAQTLRAEGISPSKWRILSTAVLSDKMAELPRVKSAIEQFVRSGPTIRGEE